jgi:hypothetical protein
LLQSDFLSRRQREHARREHNAKLVRMLNEIAKCVLFFILGLFIAQLHDRMSAPFDINQCDYLYPREALERVPDNWKEIDQTPEGNWCVTVNH